MAIVTAGVHYTLVFTGIIAADFLADRQRVHIRPKADRRSCALPLDDRNHARSRDPFVQFIDAKFAELFGHEGRGLGQIEGKLGVSV